MYRIVVLGMLSGRNGVSTSMMNLYRNLNRDLFQWDFVFFKDYKKRDNPTSSGTFEDEILSLGGRIHYLNYSSIDIPRNSRPKLRELLLSDDEIMGVHEHDLGRNVYPLYLADQLGKPLKVIQFHSGCARSEVDKFLNVADRKIRAKLDMIKGDSFDRLACSDLGGICEYRYLPFEVMPNGVDTRRFSYNEIYRKLIRNKMGIDDDTILFGFLGTVYHIKNPVFCIKIFNEYLKINPKAHFVLIGAGDMIDDVKKYARRNGIKRKIHILGQQLETDMFYSTFDIFLCPSKFEGFPNTLCEAQSSGCPCLVSDEITETVALTPLLHFASLKDPASKWAERVDKIIKDSRPRRSYAKEIKEAGYDIVDVADRLGKLYLNRIEQQKADK